MMGWHLSWAGRAFLAELSAGAKAGAMWTPVVQNRSLSCWCVCVWGSTGARGLLLLIPKDKETGLDGNNKCQVVPTTLLSPQVMGMASLTDLPLPSFQLFTQTPWEQLRWALELFILPVLLRPPLLLPPCSRCPCWDTPPQALPAPAPHLPQAFAQVSPS